MRNGWCAVIVACVVVGCGARDEVVPDGGGRGDARGDATGDPPLDGSGCTPGPTECTDCADNDLDGRTDGFDPECTQAYDDDESDFTTGITDKETDGRLECFFDGTSGSGDDGCSSHACCLLGITDPLNCPFPLFVPATCDDPQTAGCRAACEPIAVPGCDCFGCCTIHDPATDEPRDVLIVPGVAPDCSQETVLDPVVCPACTKVTDCAVACGGTTCTPCPGQDASDLPPSCSATIACPTGVAACIDGACPAAAFCAHGCCITAAGL